MSDKVTETQTLIAIGILLIMLAIVWYFLQDDVAYLVAQTRIAYLWVIGFFTDRFEEIRQWLMTVRTGQDAVDRGNVEWKDIALVSVIIGDYFRWPVAMFMLYGAYWGVCKTPRRKHKNKFNINSLMRIQARVWPVITPILDFNPMSLSARIPGTPVPHKLPMFAESLTPEEWVAWAGVVLRDGVPDKESLRQAFAKQLGVKWEGMKGLRPHHRALIAAFALKGVQKRTESADLLGSIARCWSAKGGFRLTPDVQKRIDAVLNDKTMMNPILEVARNYAFRVTAMLGMLKWCRDQGGVLAPAEFLWLRGEERTLWYPLNNLGRRSFHAEAAGVMAHFLAEQTARRALPMPRVDNALPSILDYLQQNDSKIPGVSGAPDNAKLKMA